MSAISATVVRPVPSRVLPKPHFRYTPVLQVGSWVLVSGMVALEPDTGQLLAADAAAQTRQILANLDALLHEQGWQRQHVVLARIFCTDFAQFPAINQVWDAFFTADPPPARTSVGATALPLGALVEIEFQLQPAGAAYPQA